MSQKLKIEKNRKIIKNIQEELIYEIKKFDCPNYYGKEAIQGCEIIENLTIQLILAVVELTINMDKNLENRTEKYDDY